MRKRVQRLLPGHRRTRAADNILVRGIFMTGAITTTLGAARRIKRQVDRVIARFDEKKPVVSLRATIATVKSLTTARAIRVYTKAAKQARTSGFVSVKKIGYRRGDGSLMARLSLIDWVEKKKKLKIQYE